MNKFLTAVRPAGLILHSGTEQIYFIDIIYIYCQHHNKAIKLAKCLTAGCPS